MESRASATSIQRKSPVPRTERHYERCPCWMHFKPYSRCAVGLSCTVHSRRHMLFEFAIIALCVTSRFPSTPRKENWMKRKRAPAPDGKVIGFIPPHKLQGTSKALVTPGQGCIDDVLPISTHSHKAPIRVVLEGLGVQVTAAQVLHCQR